MKWLQSDEWFCWLPTIYEGTNHAQLRKLYPEQYAYVTDELHGRFMEAYNKFRAIQAEVEKYAGKDK